MKRGFVYILASNLDGVLYIGATNNLKRRIEEHRSGAIESFTKRHGVYRCVYFEEYERITDALEREKQLKHWKRGWKINLFKEQNPEWRDLSEDL